jgi:hypothetical protein
MTATKDATHGASIKKDCKDVTLFNQKDRYKRR